jgi:hypothetical protein
LGQYACFRLNSTIGICRSEDSGGRFYQIFADIERISKSSRTSAALPDAFQRPTRRYRGDQDGAAQFRQHGQAAFLPTYVR